MGTRRPHRAVCVAHTEVQEQSKQHMPTMAGDAQRRPQRRGEATSRVKYGKVWATGRRVKKSQQESSLDDRGNLISKIHKSSSEGSCTMDTMGPSVRVNTDLLLATERDRSKLLTFNTKS